MLDRSIFKYKWTQISMRQRISPFPNYLSMECICKEMKKPLGTAYKTVLLATKGNVLHFLMDEFDHQRVGKIALEKIKKNPDFFKEIIKKIKIYAKPFIKFVKEANKRDLAKLTNRELASFQGSYERHYKGVYSHYFTILAVEKYLTEFLQDIIKKRNSDAEKIKYYFDILTKEPLAMVNRQEETASLKIALQIAQNSTWLKIFQNSNEKIIQKIDQLPKLKKIINQHLNNFFWITRDYEDPVLTINDVIERLKKNLKDNSKTKLQKYDDELKNLIIERRKTEKELKLSQKEKEYFAVMRDGANLKELRKSIISQSLYFWDSVLEEVAKRTSTTICEVRFLKTGEFKQALSDKSFSKILSRRLEKSAWWVKPENTEVFIGKEADQIFTKVFGLEKKVKEIAGFVASPGKAKGIAKIVLNPDEISKINKGDILVTIQAVPSFAPAFKKAAGVVADGGTGITSHTATLAREAHIPCISGTKIATTVLKDGDLVEIDTQNGLVRKIS